MNTFKQTTLMTFILLFLFIPTLAIANVNNDLKSLKNPEEIDSSINTWLEKTGIPSVSVVLIKKGKVAYSKAYGYQNLARKLKATNSTIYNTGSNFKSVTATAIMQLSEKGLIDIDAPINHYLKAPINYFNNAQPITARHLMSHQSGIPSSINKKSLWDRNNQRDLLTLSKQVKPQIKPEQDYQYCNDCFAILALVVEHLSKQSFEDYIWQNILEPLDITTYGFLRPSPEMIENLALPYHMRYNQAYATSLLQIEQYPAGDFFLLPKDMAKFLVMHINNGQYNGRHILSHKSIQQMHQPHASIDETFDYGLGFGIEKTADQSLSFHQGSLPGYLSSFMIDRTTQSGVYVATNVSSSSLQDKQVDRLARALLNFVNKGQIDDLNHIPTDSVTAQDISIDLKKYLGRYKIADTNVYFTLKKIGDHLFIISPSQQKFKLKALSDKHFFLVNENEDVKFQFSDGLVTGLTFHSGSHIVKAQLTK